MDQWLHCVMRERLRITQIYVHNVKLIIKVRKKFYFQNYVHVHYDQIILSEF